MFREILRPPPVDNHTVCKVPLGIGSGPGSASPTREQIIAAACAAYPTVGLQLLPNGDLIAGEPSVSYTRLQIRAWIQGYVAGYQERAKAVTP